MQDVNTLTVQKTLKFDSVSELSPGKKLKHAVKSIVKTGGSTQILNHFLTEFRAYREHIYSNAQGMICADHQQEAKT